VSIGTLAAFATVSATVIILRRTRPDLERGFRVPFGPVIPILSILACIWVLTKIPEVTWLYVIPWLALALILYYFYSHKNSVLHGFEWSDEE
jgi:APA family basic amino acid/polyamine antiporter